MASGSCQLPQPLLHASVALHELHVRAELLLAAVRITSILGRRVGRQARRCLSNLGLAELLHLLTCASLRRDLYCGAPPPPNNAERPADLRVCVPPARLRACRWLDCPRFFFLSMRVGSNRPCASAPRKQAPLMFRTRACHRILFLCASLGRLPCLHLLSPRLTYPHGTYRNMPPRAPQFRVVVVADALTVSFLPLSSIRPHGNSRFFF